MKKLCALIVAMLLTLSASADDGLMRAEGKIRKDLEVLSMDREQAEKSLEEAKRTLQGAQEELQRTRNRRSALEERINQFVEDQQVFLDTKEGPDRVKRAHDALDQARMKHEADPNNKVLQQEYDKAIEKLQLEQEKFDRARRALPSIQRKLQDSLQAILDDPYVDDDDFQEALRRGIKNAEKELGEVKIAEASQEGKLREAKKSAQDAQKQADDASARYYRAVEVLEEAEQKKALENIGNRIDSVSASVNGVRQEVASLRPVVTDVAEQVKDLQPVVQRVATEVAKLQPEIAGVKAEVAGLRHAITDVGTKVEAVQQEVAIFKVEVIARLDHVNGHLSILLNLGEEHRRLLDKITSHPLLLEHSRAFADLLNTAERLDESSAEMLHVLKQVEALARQKSASTRMQPGGAWRRIYWNGCYWQPY